MLILRIIIIFFKIKKCKKIVNQWEINFTSITESYKYANVLQSIILKFPPS